MELDIKEKAKEYFGFTSVPFLVVSENGVILEKGSPKKVNIDFLKEFLISKPLTKGGTESVVETIGSSVEAPIDVAMNKLTLDSAASTNPEFTLDEDF